MSTDSFPPLSSRSLRRRRGGRAPLLYLAVGAAVAVLGMLLVANLGKRFGSDGVASYSMAMPGAKRESDSLAYETAEATLEPVQPGAARPQAARRIVVTTNLTVWVEDPLAKAAKVEEWVVGVGGHVARSSSHGGPEPTQVALTLRIPASDHHRVAADIERMGKLSSRSTEADDVTERWVDLEARLQGQQALEQRFLEVLKQASTTANLLEVERELARVRTEIERIEGHFRRLKDQVALSTLHLVLTRDPDSIAPPTAPTLGERTSKTFERSVSGLAEFGRRLVLLVVFLVPWSPLLALIVWMLWRGLGGGTSRKRGARSAGSVPDSAADEESASD